MLLTTNSIIKSSPQSSQLDETGRVCSRMLCLTGTDCLILSPAASICTPPNHRAAVGQNQPAKHSCYEQQQSELSDTAPVYCLYRAIQLLHLVARQRNQFIVEASHQLSRKCNRRLLGPVHLVSRCVRAHRHRCIAQHRGTNVKAAQRCYMICA